MKRSSAQTFVVTGANSGVGKSTARSLATRGARVIMVCRSRDRGEVAQRLLHRQTGNRSVELQIADLSSIDEVRQLGEELAAKIDQLDGLINNAGVFRARRELTVDGFERTMATNHLSHFLLTHLLMGPLTAAAGRVVNVSSQGHRGGKLERAPLEDILRGRVRYRGMQAYADSKLANVLFSNELARRRAGEITSNALHPGVLATRIWNQNKTPASLIAAGLKPLMGSPDVGGRAVARLAVDARLDAVTGRYFDGEVEAVPAPAALDQALARRLWDASEAATGTSVNSSPRARG